MLPVPFLGAAGQELGAVAVGDLALTAVVLRLRVKDADLEQEIITMRGGKGDKDRLVPLAHM